MDFINEGLYQAIARGNEWRTILLKEYECTMMATMNYVREGCRHTCVTWVADALPPKAPVIEDAFLTSLSAANHMNPVLSYTPSDATCKVPLVIANLSPMLHQIAWCEERVAREELVSIAAKVTHVTFHAESIDRLVRQACRVHRQVGEASQFGGDAIGHRQRCFDQRA